MNRFAFAAIALTFLVSAGRATLPEVVDRLIRQLDDPRFPARRQADLDLRALGIEAVPSLRKELEKRPPLEVRRRIEGILEELAVIRWNDTLDDGLRAAAASGKPLLVLSTLGARTGIASLTTQALRQRTFTDLELVDFLNKHYVVVWHNQLPPGFEDILALPANQFLMAGPLPHSGDDDVVAYHDGRGAGNARTFICTPDGRVCHYFEGFREADAYRKEAHVGREVARAIRNRGLAHDKEETRRLLAGRAFAAVSRRMDCHAGDEKSISRLRNRRVLDLLGEPVAPLIQMLGNVPAYG